jgi:hypothetical protein
LALELQPYFSQTKYATYLFSPVLSSDSTTLFVAWTNSTIQTKRGYNGIYLRAEPLRVIAIDIATMLEEPTTSVASIEWIYAMPRSQDYPDIFLSAAQLIWVQGDTLTFTDTRSVSLLRASTGEALAETDTSTLKATRFDGDPKIYDARVVPHPDGTHWFMLRCAFFVNHLWSLSAAK